jgi:hypothetical protein
VKIVGQSADMSHRPDRTSRTAAAKKQTGATSRDAGLLRIRTLTKGAAVTSALGAVAIGVVLAQPSQSQAASPAATAAGQGSSNAQAAPAPVPPPAAQGDPQQQLAAPAQPPAAPAPQAPPPAAVSGGS